MVACVLFSSISPQRNAQAIALTMALSMRWLTAAPVSGVPSGARTSFLPPRLRIEMGMRTVMVRPSPVNVGSASNGLSRYKKGWGDTTAAFLWLPTSGIIEEPGIVPKEQELTVMGTTADKIAEKIVSQLKSNVVDLSGHRAVRQILEEARLDADGLKNLISKGHDPCHGLYIFAQNFASVLGEQLSEMKETRQFVKIVSNAEDEYQPGGPPLSPLTISYFTMWALFDVLFGQSHETIGTCILRIGQPIEMPPWLLDVIGLMQRSTMGVHVHCGCEGHLVRLRALGSQETRLCHVPSGYAGHPGELWFIRQLPPANALFDYHIVFNTPYILVDVTERMFSDYVAREIERMGSRTLPGKLEASAYIMKHGPTANHWNEYIFRAYTGHQHEAVFLTGIPDIKESLPHA